MTLTYQRIIKKIKDIGYVQDPHDNDHFEVFYKAMNYEQIKSELGEDSLKSCFDEGHKAFYEILIDYEEGNPGEDYIQKLALTVDKNKQRDNQRLRSLTLDEAEAFSALLRFKEDSEY